MSPQTYPYSEGDVVVLGPEVIATKDGSTIAWRGENYVRQDDGDAIDTAVTDGALLAAIRENARACEALGEQAGKVASLVELDTHDEARETAQDAHALALAAAEFAALAAILAETRQRVLVGAQDTITIRREGADGA